MRFQSRVEAYPVSSEHNIDLSPPSMFRNQTSRLATEPDMWPSLSILEPMLIQAMLDLTSARAIRAQRRQGLGPTVEENRCIEHAHLVPELGGSSRELSSGGIDVIGDDADGQLEVGGYSVVGHGYPLVKDLLG
jgi:hypothetical protein